MTSSHPFPNPEPRPRGRAAAEAAARRRTLRRAARAARRARRIERDHQREYQHACPPAWTPQQHAEAARRHERRRAAVMFVIFLLWSGSTIVALAYVVTARHQAAGHVEHPSATSTAAGTARMAVVRSVAFTTELPAHSTATAPASGTWAAVRPGNNDTPDDDTHGCRVASAATERGPGGLVVRTGPIDISIGDRDTHRDRDRDGGGCVDQASSRDRDREDDRDRDNDRDRAKDRGRCVCVIPGHRPDNRDWDERDQGGWDRPWNRDYPRSSWPAGPAGYDRPGYYPPAGYPDSGRPGNDVCRSYPPKVHPDVPNGGTVCASPDRPSSRW